MLDENSLENNSVYLCDDGNYRTLRELIAGLDPQDRPQNPDEVELLLWSFGARRMDAQAL